LSYFAISKEAIKIIAETTHASNFLIFLSYFIAAYASMTALLDFMMLATAVTKPIDDPNI
jgi:hypothetical protein